MAASSPAAECVTIEPPRGWVPIDLAELWRYRELVGFLALRDIRVRYKQSLLGIAWAVLQPLATMLVFGVLFKALLGRQGMPTLPGVPYAVSTYCALVPWQLFARSLQSSGDSLVANQHLITKVYFPRLVAPLAPLLAACIDFACAFAVLLGMMVAWGILPGAAALALPCFVGLSVVTALGVSLWLSALGAIYRDVRHALPFLVQIWMFASPVVYTSESVLRGRPEWLRVLYGLNPMTGVVEGFRWALLGAAEPPWTLLAASLAVSALLLVSGLYCFRRLERSFADLV
jgi:lipopolysaccharide transport system permease protein